MAVIAGDVGGSKTLLGWFSDAHEAPQSHYFDNHAHPDLESVLQQFLQLYPALVPARTFLSLAIAGPVQQRRYCQMTNLPWIIDADAIQQRFGFAGVIFLNDLEATAHAMPDPVMQTHLRPLNGRTLDLTKRVAVISIGTGLGEALLLPDATGSWTVLASEGGHKGFAPFNQQGAELLARQFTTGTTSLSWEEWFSGSGLPRLYQALFPNEPTRSSADITRQALLEPASPAATCIDFFAHGIIAEAGNVALQYWSEGGIILTGGVAQHIRPWLENPTLLAHFWRKSQYQPWLQQVPLAFCSNTDAALLGAASFGRRLLAHGGITH